MNAEQVKERTVSPAIGQFAVQENARLRDGLRRALAMLADIRDEMNEKGAVYSSSKTVFDQGKDGIGAAVLINEAVQDISRDTGVPA